MKLTQKDCAVFHQWRTNGSMINIATKEILSRTDTIVLADTEYSFKIKDKDTYKFLIGFHYYELKLIDKV